MMFSAVRACSFEERYRCFGGVYCLSIQGNGVSIFLQNIVIPCQDCRLSQLRRPKPEHSPPSKPQNLLFGPENGDSMFL
jgi:hypothetical protein